MNDLATKELEMLCKFLRACELIKEVNDHGSEFTDDLIPSCAEKFIEEAIVNINMIQIKLGILSN